MAHYCTDGTSTFEISAQQSQVYEALRIAAERIGLNNYLNGTYQPCKSKRMRQFSYAITPIHKQIIEAMPRVLDGSMDCESAMALVSHYDALKQRFGK